jgi:hypothetical protein
MPRSAAARRASSFRASSTSRPSTSRSLSRSVRLNNRFRRETSKAEKYVDHPAVCNAEFIVYGIELSIEVHPCPAARAVWPLGSLDKIRLSSKPMAGADFLASPPKLWQLCCAIIQWFRHKLERWDLLHGSAAQGNQQRMIIGFPPKRTSLTRRHYGIQCTNC